MCIKPIRIYNKSSLIPSVGGQIRLSVPCGCCFECKQAKKNSYYVRTFAEYQDIQPLVKAHQAFCYFDTLTYNNENLPMWNGIPVFNHEHIKLFLKRLRINLSRAKFEDGTPKYDVDGNLRYFICSEFGEKRHRPHYHVLFFVKFPIDVLDFWKFVREAWTYGFNDRRDSKNISTPSGLVHKRGALERVVDRNGALGYVSGYTVKDDSFMKVFHNKVKDLIDAGYKPDDKELRAIQPRFFLSRYYGLSYIDDQSAKYHFVKDYYERTGLCSIADDRKGVQDFPLPDYYRRKVYFDLKKIELPGVTIDTVTGEVKHEYKYSWIPNQNYIDYQIKELPNRVDDLANKYHDIYINLSQHPYPFLGKSFYQDITRLLNGRSWKDVAVYSALYRGRLCITQSYPTSAVDFVQNYYDAPCISLDNTTKQSTVDSADKLEGYVITDKFSPAFHDFDQIIDMLDKVKRLSRRGRSILLSMKKKQKVKYKNLINSY